MPNIPTYIFAKKAIKKIPWIIKENEKKTRKISEKTRFHKRGIFLFRSLAGPAHRPMGPAAPGLPSAPLRAPLG